MSVSKSFRAVLPDSLRADHIERIRRWSLANCAATALLHDGDVTCWLATRERARTSAQHMRSVRATLKRLLVDTRRLRGRWLALTCEELVRSESARVGAPAPAPQHNPATPETDGDEKIIALYSSTPAVNWRRYEGEESIKRSSRQPGVPELGCDERVITLRSTVQRANGKDMAPLKFSKMTTDAGSARTPPSQETSCEGSGDVLRRADC